mgnify:FL=1
MTDPHLRATVSQKAALFGPEGDVLVLRSDDDSWELPGGRIERGEATEDALRREIREETGLDAEVGWPVYTAAWQNRDDDGRYSVVYRCRVESRAVTLSDEHVEAAWCSPDATDGRLNEAQRTGVERAADADDR